ncbi:MAG: hydrogenase formation protein HypD [Eubacteriales bacterium]|nr:hydrogenase formation protein HypD [Eubacteriales bacterium]
MNSIEVLSRKIESLADGLPPTTIMEVCGTHTHAIRRYGVRQLLPKQVRLVSGPGCPVCVTAQEDVARALALARLPNVTLFCFGDMMRVPCGTASLSSLRADGADVRICVSPMDAFEFAREHPLREVVWFGVGFETTTPHTAALIEAGIRSGVKNLSILCAHKTMPNALRALLGGETRVDALLCPGHVAAITGADAFAFLPEEYGISAAISGFEPEELLLAIFALLKMQASGTPKLVNAYPRVVNPAGNPAARSLVETYFEPCDALWRGLGEISSSGLSLRPAFAKWDAGARFSMEPVAAVPASGCRCGDVLRGRIEPNECALFGQACTPEQPLGACMVSSEGACAAYYQYEGAGI